MSTPDRHRKDGGAGEPDAPPDGVFVLDGRYGTLDEARDHPGSAVALYGDSGGQVYVLAPVGMVACTHEALERLLERLDAVAWPSAGADARGISFLHAPIGTAVLAGMGGAEVVDGIWVHAELQSHGLTHPIRDVISGEADGVPPVTLDGAVPVRDRPYVCAEDPAWTLVFSGDGTVARGDGSAGVWRHAGEGALDLSFDGRQLVAMAAYDMVLVQRPATRTLLEAPLQLELVADAEA